MSQQASEGDAPSTSNIRFEDTNIVLPGGTIGMVGGGQLGRMFAIAAMQMGYDVVVYCDSADDPGAQVATRCVIGDLNDHQQLTAFAEQCDVISLEFENIPAQAIACCGQQAPTFPSHHVLATAQDRLIEKQTFRDAGLAVTPFLQVSSAADVAAFAERHAWPVIVKTARSGYDGKGQYRLQDAEQAAQVPWAEHDAWIAEQFIPFQREASVVVARSRNGSARCFPPFENEHHNHILDVSFCPSTLTQSQIANATEMASKAAEVLDLVGLLCVEFFVQEDGGLLINEVAPRPHNSGHLTIEGNHTSQFQQHVRAICGLPLGDPNLRCSGAAMANLLGDLWQAAGGNPPWNQAFSVPNVSLHLYGKRDAKEGRKMGHLTATADSPEQAAQNVRDARQRLSCDSK